MNRQTFLNYLEEPSKLYQMSLVELQGLVLEYPYSANLRLLLLLKAKLEDHPRKEEMLQQVSSRTFDRDHLYNIIRDLDLERSRKTSNEDLLELPELDKLDLSFPEAELVVNENLPAEGVLATSLVNEAHTSASLSLSSEDLFVEKEELDIQIPVAIETKVEAPTAAARFNKLIAIAASGSELFAFANQNVLVENPLESTAIEEKIAAPATVDDVVVSDRIKSRLRRHRKRQLKRLKAENEDHIKKIASESVSSHDEIASETLAKLLVHQGQYARAIKMYEQLSLLKPKKKAKFAALIQDLKEKL